MTARTRPTTRIRTRPRCRHRHASRARSSATKATSTRPWQAPPKSSSTSTTFRMASMFLPDPKRESALELGLGLIDTPFDVPNLRLETGEAVAQTRIGWFRSVNNIPHAFAMQSMVAELAAELGKDPKDFLLEMIGPARIVDPPQ